MNAGSVRWITLYHHVVHRPVVICAIPQNISVIEVGREKVSATVKSDACTDIKPPVVAVELMNLLVLREGPQFLPPLRILLEVDENLPTVIS